MRTICTRSNGLHSIKRCLPLPIFLVSQLLTSTAGCWRRGWPAWSPPILVQQLAEFTASRTEPRWKKPVLPLEKTAVAHENEEVVSSGSVCTSGGGPGLQNQW